jgi:hypothetical protein
VGAEHRAVSANDLLPAAVLGDSVLKEVRDVFRGVSGAISRGP